MEYNRDIFEIMKERHASRTFTPQKIEAEKKQFLFSAMDDLKTDEFRFDMVDYQPEDGTRVGTYGMIKGASAFLIGIMSEELSHDKAAAVRFGCAFEKLILKATELGLHTCWMVATFNVGDIKKLIQINEGENIVMASPIGHEAKRRSLERLTRYAAGSDKRKPWSELYFDGHVGQALTKEKAGSYAEVLDMVRIGPSASNKQPWRIIMTADSFDLYAGDSGYGEMQSQKISKTHNDIGIAVAQFELAANALGLEGEWVRKSIDSRKNFDYVISWKKG
jgi:nitroreductase